jgi:uncharacterized cupredoxin-like copper-binding protein
MTSATRTTAFAALTVTSILSTSIQPASSHGEHHGAAHGGTGTDGVPGNPSDVRRTVRIEARDTAFNVKQIQARPGETIRFVVTNKGELRHEFSIASHAEHEEHRAMMQQMPDMVHDDPNVITIEPGQTKELIWKFGKDTNVEFSCDLPGHAEQGMAGVFRTMK